MEISSGNYVIYGDDHGRVEKGQAIYDHYGDWPDGYISTGDSVDGPDTKACLEFKIKTLGAFTVQANHEQYLLGAMCHPDEEMRYDIASSLWPAIQDRVLESYGVHPNMTTPGTALLLRDKMEKAGHLQYLLEAPCFIEGDDFVVIHADLTDEPWQVQRDSLDSFATTDFYESVNRLMPYQLGEKVPHVVEENLTKSGLAKRLLSGHFHRSSRRMEDRTLNDGQHLLLATWPKNDYVVVYETWTQQMRLIDFG